MDKPLALLDTEPWMEFAACRGLWTTFDFDAERGHKGVNYRHAIAICHQRCPVMEQCREFATRAGDIDGVWGGELVKAQGRLPIDHGTRRGYDQHRKRGEPICDDRREAARARSAQLRAVAST